MSEIDQQKVMQLQVNCLLADITDLHRRLSEAVAIGNALAARVKELEAPEPEPGEAEGGN